MTNGKCPICAGPSEESAVTSGMLAIACGRCGKFGIESDLAAKLRASTPSIDDWHRLSSWIRHRNEAGAAEPDLTFASIDETRFRLPTHSQAERMDLLLQAIARRQEHMGARVRLDTNMAAALADVVSSNNACFVLQAMADRGWIRQGGSSAPNPGDKVRNVYILPAGQQRLEEIGLARPSPHPQPVPDDASDRVLLDLLAEHCLSATDYMSGRRIRAALPPTAAGHLETLVPEFVTRAGERPDDRYFPTLDGLLRSRHNPRFSVALASILKFLTTRFGENPDFKRFTWAEMKALFPELTDADFFAVYNAMSIARLCDGGTLSIGPLPAFHLGVIDIEGIVACKNISDLTRMARTRSTPESRPRSPMSGTSIFLVHGRDSGAKDTVARFLEKSTGREVLALSEQANRGLTIIEKFEEHAGKGCFAVVLVTPDDMGCLRADLDAAQQSDQKLALLKARARQNVVYELGYFHAKLGRRHVCALLKGAVDLPSDYSGVIYLPLDDHDGWRLKLADELRAAGIPVQL